MAPGNRTMERIRADLLRRAQTDRRREESPIQEAQVQDQPVDNAAQTSPRESNGESSRTRAVLSRLPMFPRSPTGARRSQDTNPDGDGPKTPEPAARPLTVSSSRYGEPGAPSSLPSPILLSRMPHVSSPYAADATPVVHPQGPHDAESGSDANDTFPRPTHQMREASPQQPSQSDQRPSDLESGRKAHPKRFMLCFPWVQSRRLRAQILTCFVSGVFLASLLAVYLGLALTNHIARGELTIMIILIILAATMFFCYSVIRLCILASRGDRARRRRMPEMIGPAGYAVPPKPIPVVLMRDEEAAGIESEATKSRPPAYGLWRESVRADPDRLFWQRNEPTEHLPPRSQTQSGPRPPSYASDDGVSYVVEARPRSIAPPPPAHVAAPRAEIPMLRA